MKPPRALCPRYFTGVPKCTWKLKRLFVIGCGGGKQREIFTTVAESPRNNHHYNDTESSVLNSQTLSTKIIRHHFLYDSYFVNQKNSVSSVCGTLARWQSCCCCCRRRRDIYFFSYAKGWYEWRNAVGIPLLLTFMGRAQWPCLGCDGVVGRSGWFCRVRVWRRWWSGRGGTREKDKCHDDDDGGGGGDDGTVRKYIQ